MKNEPENPPAFPRSGLPQSGMTLPACDRIIELVRDNYGAIGIQPDVSRAPAGLDARLIHEWSAAQRRRNWRDEIATLAKPLAMALNEAVRMIEEAEHATSCPWMPPLWRNELKDCADMMYNCTCWKRAALDRINELLTNP